MSMSHILSETSEAPSGRVARARAACFFFDCVCMVVWVVVPEVGDSPINFTKSQDVPGVGFCRNCKSIADNRMAQCRRWKKMNLWQHLLLMSRVQ